jgi:hypothetical protein
VIAAAVLAAAALVAGDGLDCARGFDALIAQLQARPDLETYAGGDPLLANYNDGAALALYNVTKPGHPAYPAFVKRKLNGAGPVQTSACGYGDKAAFDLLLKDIDRLNAAVRLNYGG